MTTVNSLRSRLLDALGRLDACWYWLYQGALCALDANPRTAEAMYVDDVDGGHLATCGTAARPRIPRGGG